MNVKKILISINNIGVGYYLPVSTFSHEKFWALGDFSYDFCEGVTVGLIGRNGGGKSTLLKIIADIIVPDYGTIENYSVKTQLLSLYMGFVPYLSGYQNVLISGNLLGMSREYLKSKMDEIVEFAELDSFVDQPINIYSNGMKARLAFSIAIQINPDVLLLDEILGVGDGNFLIKSSNTMKDRIRSHKSSIIASHNLPLIEEMCDEVIWLDKGKLRISGPPSEVLPQYNEYLAELMKP